MKIFITSGPGSICNDARQYSNICIENHGPVVQSIVSLTSSLRDQLVKSVNRTNCYFC